MKQLFVILLVAILLFGCASETPAPDKKENKTTTADEEPTTEAAVKKGDKIAVDYVGTLDNGTVFDTSIKEEAVNAGLPLRQSYSPLEFTAGAGQMIKGFDNAVIGMKEGEEKNIRLEPEEAYGERRVDLVFVVSNSEAPEGVQIGSQILASNGMSGTVIAADNETTTIDFNHHLAGKALNFRIIMREIDKSN